MTIQQRIGELKKELKVRGVWKLIEGEGKNALESRANYNILVEAELEGIKFALEEVGKAIDSMPNKLREIIENPELLEVGNIKIRYLIDKEELKQRLGLI